MSIDKTKSIMLTDTTAYVVDWIAKELLEEDYIIHVPVRTLNNKEKTKHLDTIAENASRTIKYVKGDLLKENSYDETAEGCELIIHTTSPFISSSKTHNFF